VEHPGLESESLVGIGFLAAVRQLNPIPMQFITERVAHKKKQDEVIVVKLWEIYLLYHPANLYKTLTDYSLNSGPTLDETVPGRIIFQFNRIVWEETVRDLLYEHRIPVIIQSNPLQALRVKGRQPVLR
jgi:hypothetical protein